MPRLKIGCLHADITTLAVDAIVNAAKPSLLGGGGVDGSIHRAAGPRLRMACTPLCGCATADAKVTPGFDLPARHVIHTVGPVWQGGHVGEAGLLASCYRRCLSLADDLALRSVAFPCISTGAYGYPATSAAQVAVATVREHGATLCHVEEVLFCCFSVADTAIYQQLLAGSPAP